MEERKLITPVSGDENALFLSMQKRRIGVRAVENLVKKYAKLVTNLKNTTKKHYAAIEEDRRRSAAKYVHLREDET